MKEESYSGSRKKYEYHENKTSFIQLTRALMVQPYSEVCVCVCVCAQSCLTLCDPMDCGPPGSSVHGIYQARILEWVAFSFSKGAFQPRDQTCVFASPSLAGGIGDTPNRGSVMHPGKSKVLIRLSSF